MDKNNLSHTTWECKYHLVFAPKYRCQVIYRKIKADVAEILSMLCKRKKIEIIEAECCKDHVHMLVRIPPKYSVSEIMGYLKGKSSLMIFEKHAHLKYKYGNRHFWCRGYYVDTVGKNADSDRNVLTTAMYGTSRINAYKILEETLNLKDVRIYDTKIDAEGNESRVLNKKETMLATQKQDAIKEAFKDWIFRDQEWGKSCAGFIMNVSIPFVPGNTMAAI